MEPLTSQPSSSIEGHTKIEYLNRIRQAVNRYLSETIENPTVRNACIEDVVLIAESLGIMQYLESKRKANADEVDHWWQDTFNVTKVLQNEGQLRFLLYRMFKEGLRALCSFCAGDNPAKAIKQMFHVHHKMQPMLNRINVFIRAIMEAYWEKHMIMTRRELDKDLRPLLVAATYAHRKKIKPTATTAKNICWNCDLLLRLVEEYSWGGITLLPECKTNVSVSRL